MIEIYEGGRIDGFLKRLETRREETSREVRNAVQDIITDVRKHGDEAVLRYTREFDKVEIPENAIRVPEPEIRAAMDAADPAFLDVLRRSAENIRRFHGRGARRSWIEWESDGVMLGQRVRPLDRVGVYVPGGRAAYASSLLMAVVPAQVAGVREIAVVSPPGSEGHPHPSILAAAGVLGLTEFYRIGGAQAVAALAAGTETVRRVDKIVGPGNLYVAEAKRQVFGTVAIDMVAGPSEVVILADETADPAFIAADLLAQAEHDPTASSVCVTPDAALAEGVRGAVAEQAEPLHRKPIVAASLRVWGGILRVKSMEEAVDLVNRLAPEHLGIHAKNAWELVESVRHAGAIFLGDWSPETVGDYWAGPNHILPTNTTARFSSPLGTDDFLKTSSLISWSRRALQRDAEPIMKFAAMEGLDAHVNAVRKRIE
ncbi:histidinol dehydrogenase [bacterium]|nr:histidinol dehydrogenase [bacterium]